MIVRAVPEFWAPRFRRRPPIVTRAKVHVMLREKVVPTAWLAVAMFVPISAVMIQAAPAKADPVDNYTAIYAGTVCELLDRAPSFGSLNRLGDAITADGFGDQVGEILVDAVAEHCPRNAYLLADFAAVYATPAINSAAIGGRLQ